MLIRVVWLATSVLRPLKPCKQRLLHSIKHNNRPLHSPSSHLFQHLHHNKPPAASDAAPQADDSLLINEPLAVAGEHGVFGYIDRDHQFILVAPVIASADGPDVEAPPGVTAVHLKWTWNPISLKTPEEAPDMPPSWTLRRFGEKSNHALLPASSSNATLRLPGAYRIRRLVRAPVRNDNSTWLVFVFSTNLTAPEQAAVVHRPRDTKQKLDEEALFFGDQTSEADFRLSKA